MEEGLIFTQDKKDIQVFFLKPQGSFSPHPHESNTWIVNDEETAKALLEDNRDCCGELKQELDVNPKYWTGNIFDNPNKLIEEGKADWMSGYEQDVNENSAGGGAHVNPLGCAPCPVGHEGHQGWEGSNLSVYEAILEVLETFEDTQLNMGSETAREILAMAIERKIKHYIP